MHKTNESSNLKTDNRIIVNEEKNIRLSQVLSLFSKGFTQTEIAAKLRVNQSTISRDLQELKQESRKYIENIVSVEIPFEYRRVLTGLDEVIKSSWQMIEEDNQSTNNNNKVSTKEKHDLLNLLQSLYTKRLQLIIGGDPKESGDSAMNVVNSFTRIKCKEKFD